MSVTKKIKKNSKTINTNFTKQYGLLKIENHTNSFFDFRKLMHPKKL